MINVVDLKQHYGVRPILKGVNLTVNSGELVGVMGPNGMGKSTLLAAIAGVLWPQKGYVEIDGVKRRNSPEGELAIRRKTVYLPDNPWLPTTRTGREFVLAVGRLYDIDDDRLFDHADRLFQLFDLTHQSDSPISSYSSGQKKKIAICGALITDASIMILDEPFSGGLDPSAIFALKRVLTHLAERDDVTVMMATPVPEIVEELANRIALIHHGELIAVDTVDGLRKHAGVEGNLQEVLEQLLNPNTLENIDQYFAGDAK